MEQLSLSLHLDKEDLRSFLEKTSQKTVSLVITDNSSSILSMKDGKKSVSLRLHRIFLSADTHVLNEIAGFIRNSKVKTPFTRSFINRNSSSLKKRAPRRINIEPQGRHFNLLDIFRSINKEYFEGRITASITWSAKRPRLAARRRTLGSYSSYSHTIRINPMLDIQRTPEYFIEFIIYHEMLHADIGIETGSARRLAHSKEFKRREKLFKDYNRTLRWEKKN